MSKALTEKQLAALENDYTAAAISVRGTFMEAVTHFEFQIEMFIGIHFSDSITKCEEMLALIVSPRLGFTEKFQVFEFLIDRYHPKNKASKGSQKIYAIDIKEIIRYRNIFAHLPTSTTDKSLLRYKKDFTLEFVKLKNSTLNGVSKLTDAVLIDKDKINKVIANIYTYSDSVREYNKVRLSHLGYIQDEP